MRGGVAALANAARRAPGPALVAAGLFLALAAVPIVFDAALYDDFTLPKQALLLVAAAITLTGLAIGGEFLPRHRMLRVFVLSWLAWLTIAFARGIDPLGGLLGYYQYRQGYLTQLSYVVLFLGALSMARRGKDGWLPWAGAAGLAGVTVYTAVQAVGADPIHWWVDTSVRAIGTIGNANELAAYAVIAFAFCGGASGLRGRARQLAGGGLVAAITFVVLESESRSGLLALGIAVAGLPVAAVAQRQPVADVARQLLVVLGGVLTGFVLSLVTGGAGGTAARVETGLAQSETANSTRIEMWKGTVSTIEASPLWGFGPDGLHLAFPIHRPADLHGAFSDYDMTVQSSHNLLLDTAAATGVVGLAIFLGFLACTGYLTVRSDLRRESTATVYVWSGLVGYGALTLVNPVSLAAQAAFFVLLGVLAGRAEAAMAAQAPLRRWIGPGLRFALATPLAVGLIAVAAAMPIADSLADRGWTAYAREDFDRSAQLYGDASRWLPFERSYARREAASWLAAGALSDPPSLWKAESAYERFDDRYGMAAGEAIGLATARIGLGEPPQDVLPVIDRALRLNPHGVFMRDYVARLRLAATAGGTLHFARKDRWVYVEISQVANR